MALTILNATPDIAGIRNELWLEYFCGGYRTSAATTASYTLIVTQQPSAGNTFRLSLPGAELEFTFVSGAPDESGLQVQIGANAAATNDNLYDALRTNWYIDQFFVITDPSDVNTLTARTPGALEVGFTNTTPVALAWNAVSAGSDAVYAANYSANFQVWIEEVYNSNVWKALPAFEGQPDENRRTRWDLHTLLRPYLGHDWPTYGATGLRVLDKLLRRYYVNRWEQYGDPPSPQVLGRGNICRAWYAGARQIEQNQMPNIWSLIRRNDVQNPFLTHRGRGGRHEVSAPQDVYLAWYRRVAKANDSQIDLRCKVYYTDGTDASTTLWTDTNGSGYTQWTVGQWNVGFDRNNLGALEPTKVPEKYEVWLRLPNGSALSETHTFWLVDTDANEQYIELVNSLGVVESVRTTGEWQLGMTPQHDEAMRLLTVVNGAEPGVEESNSVQFLRGATKPLRLFTGYWERKEFMAMMGDLLVSPEYRWVDVERSTRAPVRLVSSEVVMNKRGGDDEWVYGANLEFAVEDAETAWSDRLHWPPMPSDPEPARQAEYV